ncbi:MAG TPA: shikimate dehydrogenase, partial [Allosphingosinicella sp.]
MSPPYAEVIGDPVAHSKSPAIHRFWLDRLGIAGNYRATSLRPAALPAYLAERRADPAWRGCNVTMPLKEAVLPFLSGLDAEAEATGAANMVGADLKGFNTDVAGVRDCLEDRVVRLSGIIRIVGTGGAARAAVRGVLLAGADRNDVVVHGRSVEKAGALARALLGEPKQGRTLDPGELSGATLLINASPLGMKG